MYFGHKDVETGQNCLYEVATFCYFINFVIKIWKRVEKIKTDIVLDSDNEKKILKYFVKLNFFSLSKPNVVYLFFVDL